MHQTAAASLAGEPITVAHEQVKIITDLKGKAKELYVLGAEGYRREGHCITCHQADGNGLPAAQFPPIAQTEWVQGDEQRLIKLALHGLMGPMTIKGKEYPGLVPMTPFKHLSDEELAHVRAAGFSDAEITELIAHVAVNVLTNYFNRVADTEIDFPRITAAQLV